VNTCTSAIGTFVPRIGCCRSVWRPDGALAAKASVVDARERETRRRE
jgi:hypothetical protein